MKKYQHSYQIKTTMDTIKVLILNPGNSGVSTFLKNQPRAYKQFVDLDGYYHLFFHRTMGIDVEFIVFDINTVDASVATNYDLYVVFFENTNVKWAESKASELRSQNKKVFFCLNKLDLLKESEIDLYEQKNSGKDLFMLSALESQNNHLVFECLLNYLECEDINIVEPSSYNSFPDVKKILFFEGLDGKSHGVEVEKVKKINVNSKDYFCKIEMDDCAYQTKTVFFELSSQFLKKRERIG